MHNAADADVNFHLIRWQWNDSLIQKIGVTCSNVHRSSGIRLDRDFGSWISPLLSSCLKLMSAAMLTRVSMPLSDPQILWSLSSPLPSTAKLQPVCLGNTGSFTFYMCHATASEECHTGFLKPFASAVTQWWKAQTDDEMTSKNGCTANPPVGVPIGIILAWQGDASFRGSRKPRLHRGAPAFWICGWMKKEKQMSNTHLAHDWHH